ncbi:NTP pyrophosphatase, house-cleaning of non-canonical NTPs [Paenibacillus sp. OK060]|uniref:nucleotide pyrophosphohydrolase n=1 Tax=Paenibacillus sp. OK060 TaxID=1881034 RepID=UPI000885C935|nr:nucleotide pyrophosphohydrolase [Paenibacillus sp. OK060]SDM13914.1 NTP pyrophosphatase, house-cleaning of non-canonical NTPs [Paenibacillus sp. OK060]
MEELIQKITTFRDERNWGQFHNPKDLAISLNLEASELLEIFQWKSNEEAIAKSKDKLQDELADVLYYVLLMCNDLNIDPKKALIEKLKKNAEKYPVEKAYGSNKKYTELRGSNQE